MGITKKNLHKSQYPLIGFGGKRIEALGKIELNVTFGEGNTQLTELITFDVVDIAYPYNVIFGHNSIIKFAAVINQAYLCMKMPAAGGVITILGNQEEVRRCEDNAACAMKNIHAIEAIKTQAVINLGRCQEETRKWRNKKVRPREIKEGDLILRRILKSKQQGKVYSKWEGPFLVTSMARPEACRLRTLEGVEEPYSWNKDMLQRYYI